jgi:sulfide:quinone oxidoreductase
LKQDYLQMRVLELAPQVFATGPLFESDLSLIAKQGVCSIVNTRPDDDSSGQPVSENLARVAEEHGIAFVYMPVDAATLTRAEAEKFMQTCEALKRPLLVCGRSGGYATRIWEKAESLWLEPPDSG